jgi:hypothetical protein
MSKSISTKKKKKKKPIDLPPEVQEKSFQDPEPRIKS